MRVFIIAALCIVPRVSLLGQATPLSAAVRRGLESITAADVKRRIEIIADDSMGGRDTPSRGLEATARYIAAEFRRFGLTAAGDSGGFIQRYPLPGRNPNGGQSGRARTAPNVVGVLEGSDPVLKNEYMCSRPIWIMWGSACR